MEELFSQEPEVAAQQLLGREIVRDFHGSKVRGIITEVSAWKGTYGEHTKHKFDKYKPGALSVSKKYGKTLMDLTVGDGGSCLTLIAGRFEDGHVQGPGNLSKKLLVDEVFDGYDLLKGEKLWIEGSPVDGSLVKMRKRSKVPPNCRGYYYIK